MEYYVFMLVVILLCVHWQISGPKYVYRESGKEMDLSLLLPCMFLFFFAAVRAVTVGADTRQYQIVFQLCAEEKWSNLISSHAQQLWFNLKNIEIGYKYYNKLLSCFWNNPQIITIVNSFFILFPLYRLIKKYSTDGWLSIFLFFTLGFYQTALNLTPLAIASLIVLNGLEYMKEEKPIQYMICILVASAFHYSAFLFLPLYFLHYFKLTAKRFWIVLVSMFSTIALMFSGLILVFRQLVPERYQMYLQASVKKEQLFVYIVQLLLIVYCIWRAKGQKDFWNKNQIFLNFFLAESAAYFCTLFSSGFSRVTFLLSPLLVITIPKLLERDDGNCKREERCYKPYIVRISKSTVPIVLYGIAVYLFRIFVNNIGMTMPYVFYWAET